MEAITNSKIINQDPDLYNYNLNIKKYIMTDEEIYELRNLSGNISAFRSKVNRTVFSSEATTQMNSINLSNINSLNQTPYISGRTSPRLDWEKEKLNTKKSKKLKSSYLYKNNPVITEEVDNNLTLNTNLEDNEIKTSKKKIQKKSILSTDSKPIQVTNNYNNQNIIITNNINMGSNNNPQPIKKRVPKKVMINDPIEVPSTIKKSRNSGISNHGQSSPFKLPNFDTKNEKKTIASLKSRPSLALNFKFSNDVSITAQNKRNTIGNPLSTSNENQNINEKNKLEFNKKLTLNTEYNTENINFDEKDFIENNEEFDFEF